MATCAYCNTTIIFGGERAGDLRFCNTECLQRGHLAAIAERIPAAQAERFTVELHRGPCPKCGGPGPVDVHTSYRVVSVLVLTSWSSRPTVCCGACGSRQRLWDFALSAFVGWWGFPWGLVMTPVQLGRNIHAWAKPQDPLVPSATLQHMARLQLAGMAVAERRELDPAAMDAGGRS